MYNIKCKFKNKALIELFVILLGFFMISKRKDSIEQHHGSTLSHLAEKPYSERLSQTSKMSIGHITCKVLSWLNGHEHGVFAFARFGDVLHTKLMHPNR